MDEAGLLAADVVRLEADNHRLAQEARIMREMVQELLGITHQALAYIASRQWA